jgi:hypothetical protein
MIDTYCDYTLQFSTLDAILTSEVAGPCVESDVTNVGMPQAAPSFIPTNPKDIITQALPQISSMQDSILARQMDISSGTWNNGTDDVVEVLSMPVFMISQALEAIANIKEVGEKEKKDKKVALILEILGIIFAFIPFLDELGPPSDSLMGPLRSLPPREM